MSANMTATWEEHPCENSVGHTPPVFRTVYHHIQPHEAGGETVDSNMVWVCDTDHYSIHRLLWMLAKGEPIGRLGDYFQRDMARRGYEACVLAGTVDKIPNEG